MADGQSLGRPDRPRTELVLSDLSAVSASTEVNESAETEAYVDADNADKVTTQSDFRDFEAERSECYVAGDIPFSHPRGGGLLKK